MLLLHLPLLKLLRLLLVPLFHLLFSGIVGVLMGHLLMFFFLLLLHFLSFLILLLLQLLLLLSELLIRFLISTVWSRRPFHRGQLVDVFISPAKILGGPDSAVLLRDLPEDCTEHPLPASEPRYAR